MTEKDSKLYSLKYFHILEGLLDICDKYEISEQDHILKYGKSASVCHNYKGTKIVDQEHRDLKRIQVAKSILSLVFKFSKVVVCTFNLFLLIILLLNSSVNPVNPLGSTEVTL